MAFEYKFDNISNYGLTSMPVFIGLKIDNYDL